MMTLHWYANRLRNMSPAEIAHRVTEKQRKIVSKGRHEGWARFDTGGTALPRIDGFEDAVLAAPAALREALDRTATRLLDGEFAALGVNWPKRDAHALFPQELWRLDPVSGQLWQGGDAYCFDIAYRHERRLGDIKYVWEFNRLQFLVPLAAKLALDDDPRALAAIEACIESWHGANPPYRGLVWNSGIELALRAISLILTASICGSRLSPATIARMREMLAAHAFWLRRFPSRFSSANNHLIAEAAGEYLIGLAMPDLPDAARMTEDAKRILEEEIALQILPDGVPAEQSPTYGAFSIEFALVAAFAARTRGETFGRPFAARLAAFTGFLDATGNADGASPAVCDDDEGRVVSMCEEEPAYAASVANAAMAFMGAATPLPTTRPHLRDVLFGRVAHRERKVPAGLRSFPAGGVSVIDMPIGRRRAKLLMDHGPLGYLAIAAHGHADALSIALTIDDIPVLVDPGTYLYHSGGAWRDWFRSTRAHNTLTVGGADQSIMAGAFNWSHKAQARLIAASDTRIEAEHDGYVRRFGAGHVRMVEITSGGLRIDDRLEGGSKLPVELVYQFAPGLKIEVDGRRAVVRREGVALATFTLPAGQTTVAEGEDRLDGGWVSPSFGIKRAAPRLSVRTICNGEGLTTDIRLDGA